MLIKEFVTKPLREHDTDYPWYRPGNIPANTCSYPYEFAYPSAYPTYTVTQTGHMQTCMCVSCGEKKQNVEKEGENNSDKNSDRIIWRWIRMLFIVFLILIGVFIAARLLQ